MFIILKKQFWFAGRETVSGVCEHDSSMLVMFETREAAQEWIDKWVTGRPYYLDYNESGNAHYSIHEV